MIDPPVTGRAGSKTVRQCYSLFQPIAWKGRPFVHVEPFAGGLGSLVQAANQGIIPKLVIAGEKSAAMRQMILGWHAGQDPLSGDLAIDFCNAYQFALALQSGKAVQRPTIQQADIEILVAELIVAAQDPAVDFDRFLKVPKGEDRNLKLLPANERGFFHNLFKVICDLEYEGDYEAIAIVHAVAILGFIRRNRQGRLNVSADPDKVLRLAESIRKGSPNTTPKPWELKLFPDADQAVKAAIKFANQSVFVVLDPPYFVPLDAAAAKAKRLSAGGSLGQSYEFHTPHSDAMVKLIAGYCDRLTAANIPVVLYQYSHPDLEQIISGQFRRIFTRFISNRPEFAYINRAAAKVCCLPWRDVPPPTATHSVEQLALL